MHADLRVKISDVPLDRSLAQHEGRCDLTAAVALSDELQNPNLLPT
jgi:hypothetical protein